MADKTKYTLRELGADLDKKGYKLKRFRTPEGKFAYRVLPAVPMPKPRKRKRLKTKRSMKRATKKK